MLVWNPEGADDVVWARLREHFTVDEIVVEDSTVIGIRGHGASGRSTVERATVVIGADGRFSRVARAVNPETYHQKPALQQSYYTYPVTSWPASETWRKTRPRWLRPSST